VNRGRRRRVQQIVKQGEQLIEGFPWARTQMRPYEADMAMVHAINLGFIIVFGKPKIAEPLSRAWQRCLERYPDFSGIDPFRDWSRALMASLTCKDAVLSSFTGKDEKEKCAALFATAPPWLLWFTHADFTAGMLGNPLPDLSSVRRFVRSEETVKRWPLLPDGMFECCPWPDGSNNEPPLTASERQLVRDEILHLGVRMTPRERQRALDIFLRYGDGQQK
jgi:hypothetical protein